MTTTVQYDFEVFAERISQVPNNRLTEEEFKRDFPEIEYPKEFNGNPIVSIDNFLFNERSVLMVARSDNEVTVLKVAQFGADPTLDEKNATLAKALGDIAEQLAAFEADPASLVNPETGGPFTNEEERNEYLMALNAAIPMLEAELASPF